MTAVETSSSSTLLRESLHTFWQESLEIASTLRGLEFTVPQSYPDGWQIVLQLSLPTATTARLSDGGKTLWQLAQTGQNIEADATAQRIRELCDTYQVKRDGWELLRFLPWPTPGAEIHLFTEALVSIAHLANLHEPVAQTLNVAR